MMNSFHKINSLYVHIPYCVQLCEYCDFYKLLYNDDKQFEGFYQLLESQKRKLMIPF